MFLRNGDIALPLPLQFRFKSSNLQLTSQVAVVVLPETNRYALYPVYEVHLGRC